MDNVQFTEDEIKYINADAFDKTNNIYAYPVFHSGKLLPNLYIIICNKLPIGKYILSGKLGKKIDFDFNTNYRIVYGDLGKQVKDLYTDDIHAFAFEILNNTSYIRLKTKLIRDVKILVKTLREQAVINTRKLEQESLIQKDIKAHTNLGERYNTMSFYDTIEECLSSGTELLVDETKSPEDIDVRYLQMIKALQDISRIEQQQKTLELEKAELENKKNNLLKY